LKLPSAEVVRTDLRIALQEQGEVADPRILDALEGHLRLLAHWNSRYRLTRIESWNEILDRHVRESLLPLKWITDKGRLLDVGSGNGFPAIPILACRPGLEAVLMERSERKAMFLDAVVRECAMCRVSVEAKPLDVRPQRHDLQGACQLEKTQHDEDSLLFGYVISRATLPPASFLEVAANLARIGGHVFLYAGSAAGLSAIASVPRLSIVSRTPIRGRTDSLLFVLQVIHVT